MLSKTYNVQSDRGRPMRDGWKSRRGARCLESRGDVGGGEGSDVGVGGGKEEGRETKKNGDQPLSIS